MEAYLSGNPDSDLPEWLASRVNVFSHYCYFVMTTISTNGYGDISPNKDSTVSEMLFAMFLMFIGVMLMSGVIALTSTFLNDLRDSRQKHKQKIKDFEHWFRVLEQQSKANFLSSFVNRIKKFFAFLLTCEFNNTLYDGDFFLQLPEKLGDRLELEYAQRHEQVFDKVFSKFSEPFCIKLIKQSQAICWMAGDKLIQRGDFLPGVYFVAKGKIQVSYLNAKNVARIYRKGSSLGWSCLNDKPSHFNFTATELTLTLFIPVDTLAQLAEEFPLDYSVLTKMGTDEESGFKSEKIFLKSLIATRGVQGHQKLFKLADTLDQDDTANTISTPSNSNRQRRQSVYIDKNQLPGTQPRGRRSSVSVGTSPAAIMQNSEMVSGIAIARLLLGSQGDTIIQGIQALLKSSVPSQESPTIQKVFLGGIPEPEPEANLGRGSSNHTDVSDNSTASALDMSKFKNALDVASQRARIFEDSFELDEGPLSENILDGLDFGSVLQTSEKHRDYYEKLIEQAKRFGPREIHEIEGADTAENQTQEADQLDRSILMAGPEVSLRLDESPPLCGFFGIDALSKVLQVKSTHLQRKWRVFETVSKLQLHKQLLKLRFCQEEALDLASLGGALQLIGQQEERLKADLVQQLGSANQAYLAEIQRLVQW